MVRKERQGWYWAAFIVVVWIVVIAVINRPYKQAKGLSKKSEVVVLADGMSLSKSEDPTKVFQKAFWRHPSSDDKILHAERREWSTAQDGVRKWQWFIAVIPGVATREWLDTNPFQLSPISTATMTKDSPQWFPGTSAMTETLQKPGGGFTLGYSKDRKILYATDSGFGFESAEAEAVHR